MAVRRFTLAAAAAVAAAFRHADMVPVRARGGRWYRDAVAKDKESGVMDSAPLYFKQLIWHNDTTKGTFQQKYYKDDTNFTSGLCFL